ncbi:acyl-CoA dehydrogenase [Jonesia quinghaiensis]|uniref:acyl-CoA dehydrogenase family protein n=1 Tax=Jonesia quinghaiensis TaxID=262806 RepID=UPI0004078BA4|nr:acyl-CoA dehydrogenase [Jonesia quinghaiensis]
MTAVSDRPTQAGTHAPTINHDYLAEHLLGRWADLRKVARNLARDERLIRDPHLPMDEHRERVLEQLKILVNEAQVLRAFPTRMGGKDDAGGGIAGFEELVAADPSLQIKSGVQWGLFCAAIHHLGTEEQQDRLLENAMRLVVPGAFAMTEIGHGSDVASIGTTATFDTTTGDFVLNTPFRAAWKDYLGNAARHGTTAVVFAQLITNGVNHGVHAFYVPIRETLDDGSAGDCLPGIQSEDDGLKGGLNGIDNGRLAFDHVRVPRENLLARYGSVTEGGNYSSPIDSPGRRFFTMLGSLVQGRVSLDGAAGVASKIALSTAITYGNQRRQFTGASEHDETVIMDYQTHQRRLLPLLAEVYAGHFAHDRLLDLFHAVFSEEGMDTPETREDLETMAAALKPTSTWRALHTLQTAREACGGAGFMAENRLVGLRQDLDIYVTFEGDNTVLLQLVGKRLLSDYAKQFKGIDGIGMARFVVERTADTVLYKTPLNRTVQSIRDSGLRRRSATELRDEETQRELLTDRVETMVETLAQALRPASKMSQEKAAALFNSHQAELIDAAKAHADLLQWEAFTKALLDVEDDDTRTILTWVRDLYGLHTVEKNLAWYLIHGRLSGQRAQTVTSYIDRLLLRLRPHAQDLIDAFGLDDGLVRATIATGVEQRRQDEARAYYRKQRASGNTPVAEKALKKSQR